MYFMASFYLFSILKKCINNYLQGGGFEKRAQLERSPFGIKKLLTIVVYIIIRD